MGLSCGAVCPCRPGQLLDSLVEAASTVAEPSPRLACHDLKIRPRSHRPGWPGGHRSFLGSASGSVPVSGCSSRSWSPRPTKPPPARGHAPPESSNVQPGPEELDVNRAEAPDAEGTAERDPSETSP